MSFRRTSLALLSLALLALPASAQPVDQNCLVGGQRGTGVTQIATNCPIGRAPALTSFRFGFFNGDHKFRQATIMPNGETFEAAFGDSGGEDPYFVEGRWLRVPEASGGVVTAVVRGIADIQIPAGPPNTTLVLSGFEFKRADGTDANIRTIAIALDGPRHTVRTVLLDDQGNDYSNLPAAIAVGFLIGAAGAPDPNLSFAAADIAQTQFNRAGARLTPGVPTYEAIPPEVAPPPAPAAAGGTGHFIPVRPGTLHLNPGLIANIAPPVKVSSNSARPYEVRVAYVWVPSNRLINTRTVSGSGRNRSETSGALPPGNRHVLQGFSFNFGNSDHYIADFGVHLSGGAPVQTNISHDEVVSWEDANRDDPMTWTARISNLIPPPGAP